MYSTAITRIPVNAPGVYLTTDPRDKPKNVVGRVTLNVVDGRLNSVSIKPAVGKTVNLKAHKVESLFAASASERLVFLGFTR